jgi:hypothetical protein
LFDLAYLCHIPAPLVDALRFMDFVNYVLGIDAYHEAINKQNEQ